MHLIRSTQGLMILLIGAGMVGCAEKNTPLPGPSQDAMAAQQRAKDLERQLDEATANAARDREHTRAMENELAGLRKQLAERPEPAAAPAPGWNTVPGGAMTSIEGTILFASGKATLKPSARETLDSVVRVITQKYPDYDVYVFGHTDDTPIRKSGWKDNYELSAQRSLSVVRMMREMGVENKMAASGWGEQLPIESARTASARQRNRRVEIYAMAPEKARSGHMEASPPSGAGRGGEEPALERPQPARRQQPPRRRAPAASTQPSRIP